MEKLSLKLSALLFIRDLKDGNLSILLSCLVVSIASVSAVQFLANRIQFSLSNDIRSSLAADKRIVSDRQIPVDWLMKARDLNLSMVEGVQFPSMAFSRDEARLVSVKAVTDSYPLYGELKVSDVSKDGTIVYSDSLSPGEAYVDSSLLPTLKLQIGDTFFLGDSNFKIAGVIDLEPDRGLTFVNFAPRVLIKRSDLAATGLIEVGSRVSYRLWAASENPQSLEKFEKYVKGNLSAGQRLDSLESARPELNETIDKARSFLSLTGLMTIILAAVAMALSSRHLANKNFSTIVIMKAFGGEPKHLRHIWLFELVFVTVLGFLLGVCLGYFVQFLLTAFLNYYSEIALPDINVLDAKVFIQCFGISGLLVFIFAWPVVDKVIQTPPSRAMRSSIGVNSQSVKLLNVPIKRNVLLVLGFALLLLFTTGDFKLALLLGFSFATLAFLFFIFSLVGLNLVSMFKIAKFGPLWFRWAWSSFSRATARRGNALTLQVMALGIAISAIIQSSFVQDNLVSIWKSAMSESAPNHFLINIQPNQINEMDKFFEKRLEKEIFYYPMVRGRLIARNGEEFVGHELKSMRAKRLLNREINLSYGEELPNHNEIVTGRGIDPKANEVSIEEDFARVLGINVGDQLTFDVAGQNIDSTVSSIRSLRWESMRVNFFVFASPELLKDKPKTYITAFNTSGYQAQRFVEEMDKKKTFKADFLKNFSNVTVVDLTIILNQVRFLLTQAILTIQFLFGFSVLAAFLVLWATLSAAKEEREKEVALMRVLGADQKSLALAQWFELSLIGLLAGTLGGVFSQIVGLIVLNLIFNLNGVFNFPLICVGALIGIVVSMLSGFVAMRNIVKTPPILVLRNIS